MSFKRIFFAISAKLPVSLNFMMTFFNIKLFLLDLVSGILIISVKKFTSSLEGFHF